MSNIWLHLLEVLLAVFSWMWKQISYSVFRFLHRERARWADMWGFCQGLMLRSAVTVQLTLVSYPAKPVSHTELQAHQTSLFPACRVAKCEKSNLDESFTLSWKGFYNFLVKPWPLLWLPSRRSLIDLLKTTGVRGQLRGAPSMWSCVN